MSFIRGYITEKRTHFSIWLIALLCVIVFVYAQDPARNWTYRLLYDALDAALNTAASINYVTPKKLDDKVRDLENDLREMKVEAAKLAADVVDKTYREELASQHLDDATGAFKAAEAAVKAAETAKSNAKTAYDTSVSKENTAYLNYRMHTTSCYECDNEITCWTAHHLLTSWNNMKKELTQNKANYEAAKKDLKDKKNDLMVKKTKFHKAQHVYQIWSHKLDKAKLKLGTQRLDIADTETELEAKVAEKTMIDALVLDYPNLMTYMDTLDNASNTNGFDFETFIRANPVPSFIQQYGHIEFNF